MSCGPASRLGSPRLLRVLAVAAGVAACAAPDFTYKMYPGPVRPLADVAVIELADAQEAQVGARKVRRSDYARVHVLPGPWHVRWTCLYGVSVMIEPTGFAGSASASDVELEAGHTYSLHCDRTTGPGYETFQWMRDDTAGRILAGAPKP
jgi:hypothetical protein